MLACSEGMVSDMTLTITLPLPPKELSPNARVHWRAKAAAVKRYRSSAKWAAIDAQAWHLWHRKSTATAQCTFYFAQNRRRDSDNLLASLKAGFLGIVDAGVIADDCGLTHLAVIVRIDEARPRVEIRLTAKGTNV